MFEQGVTLADVRGIFVYDPENVGYFIRRNTNELFSDGDFQDIPLWREMNYKVLRTITEKYEGIIIKKEASLLLETRLLPWMPLTAV